MFKDKASDYCYYNGQLKLFKDIDIKEFEESDQLVYEVIKIIDGKPLFWKEHIERIYLSFEKIGIKLDIDKEKFTYGAREIVDKDKLPNTNIKILVGVFNKEANILIYNIKSSYPSEEIKNLGVRVKAFKYERNNPNAKVVNLNYKKEVAKFILENELFEALLVDNNGVVTEGSRSNIFFIKDGRVFTPKSSGVLLGITRMKLLELLKNLNIEFLEADIALESISEYDGAFLSGTSINALAIKNIGDLVFDSAENETFKMIRESFEKMILEETNW